MSHYIFGNFSFLICKPYYFQSSVSDYVPLLVEMCTNIVEEKGLEVIGIYR